MWGKTLDGLVVVEDGHAGKGAGEQLKEQAL